MAVTVVSVSAKANCPKKPVKVGQNVGMVGEHVVKLKNAGPSSETGEISISIEDSDGNSNKATEPFGLESGASETLTFQTLLNASYNTAGAMTVTAKTAAKGSTKSATDKCSFAVQST